MQVNGSRASQTVWTRQDRDRDRGMDCEVRVVMGGQGRLVPFLRKLTGGAASGCTLPASVGASGVVPAIVREVSREKRLPRKRGEGQGGASGLMVKEGRMRNFQSSHRSHTRQKLLPNAVTSRRITCSRNDFLCSAKTSSDCYCSSAAPAVCSLILPWTLRATHSW